MLGGSNFSLSNTFPSFSSPCVKVAVAASKLGVSFFNSSAFT
jgi:hypothetical protein